MDLYIKPIQIYRKLLEVVGKWLGYPSNTANRVTPATAEILTVNEEKRERKKKEKKKEEG